MSSDRIQQLESVEGWIWDPIEWGFQEGMKKLKEYVKKNHQARVPDGHTDEDGYNLGNWVSSQRTDYKNGQLSSDRIQQLEKIEGWIWDPIEWGFQEGMKKLKEYVKKNHHAKVPARYTDESGFNLGNWVVRQRKAYKNGKLSSDHIQEFKKVKGWIWDLIEWGFQEGMKKLKKYVKKNHHARVPDGYTDESGFNLGNWVSNRRKDYKNGQLSSDRIQQLESVEGWIWDPIEWGFQEGMKKLKKYVKKNHHARVPDGYTDESGFNLGYWVARQRKDYKKGKLSSDRIQQLETVDGWIWDARVK